LVLVLTVEFCLAS
jgi:hypothetical protein